jgi:OFA family oxalate/formate antiporter-like MFS transporter
MPIGVKVMKKVNAKTCCIVAGICMGVLFYMSSYCTTFITFALIFGIGGGSIIGFLYMIPVAHCYKYFPKKKGTVSGIIVAGSGFGTFLFSLVAVSSINPNNVPLTSDYYGSDIA